MFALTNILLTSLIVGSPHLPPKVILRTPPRSPVLNNAYAPVLTMQSPHPHFIMEPTIFNDLPDLRDYTHASVNETAVANQLPRHHEISEWQIDRNWPDWNVEADLSNLDASYRGCSMMAFNRYSTLLNPSPWFQFTDWLFPKLEGFFHPRSPSSGISTVPNSTGVTRIPLVSKDTRGARIPVVLKDMMGLSTVQSEQLEKATRFFSSVIPERFQGESLAKIENFRNPAQSQSQAQIQVAELLLSMFANNHKLLSVRKHSEDIRKWITEIPPTLLELIIQEKHPTAVAITSSILQWSAEWGYFDVFQSLLKANLDTAHFSGTEGGRLLIQTLYRGLSGKNICLQMLKCNPSLNICTKGKNTPLHIAAEYQDPELLEALVDKGYSLTAENDRIYTPIDVAIRVGKRDNVSWFLENGIEYSDVSWFFCERDFVPTFEICNIIWDVWPGSSSILASYILIFSSLSGPDEFAIKVDEISAHYPDMTPILEEALCIVMELFYDVDASNGHYMDLHSDDYDECSHQRERSPSSTRCGALDVFMKYGVDTNARSVTDWDLPLVSAIKLSTIGDVETLLNYGAKLDQEEILDALFLEPNTLKRFQILKCVFLHRQADIEKSSKLSNGQWPLQAVCRMHKGPEGVEIVQRFVENGAEVNSVSQNDQYTALHFAVQHGQFETVRYLIGKGAQVRGWLKTPVKFLFELCVERCPYNCDWAEEEEDDENAEMLERLKVWELLLEVRAEVDDSSEPVRFNFGNSLAEALKTWPHPELNILMRTVKEARGSVLLSESWGGKYQGRGPFSPLQLAAKRGYFDTVKTLLEMGANINEPAGPKNGGTALQMAASITNLKLVTYLLDQGADVNACGAAEYGMTALQVACRRIPVSYEIISLLLQRGADVNGPPSEDSGRTALQFACAKREVDFELVNLLIKHGADVNAEPAPIRGITALQGAVIHGDIELVLYLLERGAKVDAPGARVEGRTAIEAAAEHGRLTIAQILLNAHRLVGYGLDLEKAIALAEEEGHFGVVKLLEDALESWI